MHLYKRGGKWWYEFVFHGQRIRQTTDSANKVTAERVMRERRRSLELGAGGVSEIQKPLLFSIAAKKWHKANKPHWTESNAKLEQYNINSLLPVFGKMLLSDIRPDDVGRYQARRKKEGLSNRTINMGVGTLRSILRKHRMWERLSQDVKMLRVRNEVGRALTAGERDRLLAACKKSRSRSLYPAVLLSLHTGLRNGELRQLKWRQIDLLEKQLIVGKSKTAAGEDRIVPLSETAFRCIQDWRSLFPNAQPSHYVFPSERYAAKNDPVTGHTTSESYAYDTDPTKPIQSWKSGWTAARKVSGVKCRWHDCRHDFLSRLSESQASDSTIMALAGHVSRKMMERYSHTRNEAKRQAIAILDADAPEESPQFPPQ